MPPRCAFGLLPEGGLLHYGGPIAKNPAVAGFARKLEAASAVRTGRGEPVRTARKRRSQALYLSLVSLRSEEHTSELQSLMRISYAVFCLKKTNHASRIPP